jgi:hypothetical protein
MRFVTGHDWPLGVITAVIALPILAALTYIFFDGGAVFTDPVQLKKLLIYVGVWILGILIIDRIKLWRTRRDQTREGGLNG